MEEMFRFLESLLSDGTQFTVRRVYQYDTFPGYTLLGYDDRDEDGLRFDEPWMKLFEDQVLKFKEQIENALMHASLLDNKIGVVLDFKIKNWRNGMCGTVMWCHKDHHNGFFFSCAPNTYVKDNLNVEFTFKA